MIPCEITPRPDAHIHKWNITSRLELLLAKIAGHDVNLGTMTPPVATNLTEELLLEIADRLDNSGGEGGGNANIIYLTDTDGELNASYEDIEAAFEAGSLVFVKKTLENESSGVITTTTTIGLIMALGYIDDTELGRITRYLVYLFDGLGDPIRYYSDSATGNLQAE